jgi:KUP system potassium uptake protein
VLTLYKYVLGMATTIRIDDTVRPTRSNLDRTGTGFGNGIYPYRSQSRASSHNRSIRGRRGSFDKRSQKSGDQEAAVDEDSGLRQAGDFKKRQVGDDSK